MTKQTMSRAQTLADEIRHAKIIGISPAEVQQMISTMDALVGYRRDSDGAFVWPQAIAEAARESRMGALAARRHR